MVGIFQIEGADSVSYTHLTKEQKDAIVLACQEILNGEHHEQFPVDMIQGGAGTSTNMKDVYKRQFISIFLTHYLKKDLSSYHPSDDIPSDTAKEMGKRAYFSQVCEKTKNLPLFVTPNSL